jgi:hypothetical protein
MTTPAPGEHTRTRYGAADLGPVTQPQPAVPPAPLTPEQTRGAVRDIALVLLVRGVLALVATAALVVGAYLLYRHGMRADTFPGYADDRTSNAVVHYSPPWIAAAAGLLLLAGLALTAGIADLLRRARLRVVTSVR